MIMPMNDVPVPFYLTLNILSIPLFRYVPVDIYLFKARNRNTRTICKISSKFTIKTPECVLIVNFEKISHIVLVFLLFTLKE